MNTKIEKDQWVWVVVQDPGKNEQFLGQYDEDSDRSFIPIFLEKDEANEGLAHLKRDEKLKYEPHAILYEEIAEHASQQGFELVVLDGKGKVLK
jgi:hypothetical protein